MEVVWVFLIVFVALVTYNAIFNRPCGTLKIDHSNPEKDVYRFEIDNLDSLSKKKRIVLKVDNNADLSRK